MTLTALSSRELGYVLLGAVVFFAIATVLNPGWVFIPHFTADEMYPLRSIWFYDEVVAQDVHTKYQDSRLASILPGHFFFSVMDTENAKLGLHFYQYAISLLGIFACLRLLTGSLWSFGLVAVLALWDKFLWYHGVLYSSSTGLGYLFFGVALVAYGIRHADWRRSAALVSSGVCAGMLVHSHGAWVVYGFPLFSMPVIVELLKTKDFRSFFWNSSWVVVLVGTGGVILTLVLGFISALDGGSLYFFEKSLDVVLNNPYQNASFYKHESLPFVYADAWWLYLPIFSTFLSLGVLWHKVVVRESDTPHLFVILVIHITLLAYVTYQWLFTASNYLSKPETMVYVVPTTLLLLCLSINEALRSVPRALGIGLFGLFLTLCIFPSLLSGTFVGLSVIAGILPEFPLLLLIATLLVLRMPLWSFFVIASLYLLVRISFDVELFGYAGSNQFLLPVVLFSLGMFMTVKNWKVSSSALLVVLVFIAALPKAPLDGDPKFLSDLFRLSKQIASSDYSKAKIWYDRSGEQGRLLYGVTNLLPSQQAHYPSFPRMSQTNIFHSSFAEASPAVGSVLLVHQVDDHASFDKLVGQKLSEFDVRFEKLAPHIDLGEAIPGSLVPIRIVSDEQPPIFLRPPRTQEFGKFVEPIELPLSLVRNSFVDGELLEIEVVLRPKEPDLNIFSGYNDTSPPMPFRLGPLYLYGTEVESTYRLVLDTTHTERLEFRIRLDSDDWTKLRFSYSSGELTMWKNGRLLTRVTADPVFSSANAVIGSGFLNRRWSGEFVSVSIETERDSGTQCLKWLPGDVGWNESSNCENKNP